MKLIKKFKVELIMCSLVVGCILMIFGNATIGGLLLLPAILFNVFKD